MSWKNQDCHELLAEALRKSDERDRELVEANRQLSDVKRAVNAVAARGREQIVALDKDGQCGVADWVRVLCDEIDRLHAM